MSIHSSGTSNLGPRREAPYNEQMANVNDLPPHIREQAAGYARESGVAQTAAATAKDVNIDDTNRPEVLRAQEAKQEYEKSQQPQQPEQQPEQPER